MLFNTWLFVWFFAVVYLLYLRLGHRGQNWVLLVASYIFYGFWDYRFLSLIFLSTVIDYHCGQAIDASSSKSRKKRFLLVSVAANLSFLSLFKYYNFFVENLLSLCHAVGYFPSIETMQIILPVGISFYTFQTMSYTIDIYFGKMKPCTSFRDFALFVAFFPQLVAGPIERARNLIWQIEQPRILSSGMLMSGVWLIVQGYFLKVVVADNAAVIANQAFAQTHPSGATALLGIYAFALQIYGDFAGYSHIARGLANLMGIQLMLNFRQPYFAVSPSEFWTRWHISLSSWLRDYLYIPLGGNRKGSSRTYVNLAVTMLLGGLWHGASWIFIIWGAYQGLILIVFRWFSQAREQTAAAWSVMKPLQILGYFQLTCLGWLIFRAESVSQIFTYPKQILLHFDWQSAHWEQVYVLLFLGIPVLLLDAANEAYQQCRAVQDSVDQPTRVRKRVIAGCALACVGMLLLMYLCGYRGGGAFIYFQF